MARALGNMGTGEVWVVLQADGELRAWFGRPCYHAVSIMVHIVRWLPAAWCPRKPRSTE